MNKAFLRKPSLYNLVKTITLCIVSWAIVATALGVMEERDPCTGCVDFTVQYEATASGNKAFYTLMAGLESFTCCTDIEEEALNSYLRTGDKKDSVAALLESNSKSLATIKTALSGDPYTAPKVFQVWTTGDYPDTHNSGQLLAAKLLIAQGRLQLDQVSFETAVESFNQVVTLQQSLMRYPSLITSALALHISKTLMDTLSNLSIEKYNNAEKYQLSTLLQQLDLSTEYLTNSLKGEANESFLQIKKALPDLGNAGVFLMPFCNRQDTLTLMRKKFSAIIFRTQGKPALAEALETHPWDWSQVFLPNSVGRILVSIAVPKFAKLSDHFHQRQQQRKQLLNNLKS